MSRKSAEVQNLEAIKNRETAKIVGSAAVAAGNVVLLAADVIEGTLPIIGAGLVILVAELQAYRSARIVNNVESELNNLPLR
jgi:hypothetical protein